MPRKIAKRTRKTGGKRTITRGTATRGTATRGTATRGTATRGTATRGTATRGTATRGTRRERSLTRTHRTATPPTGTRRTPTPDTEHLSESEINGLLIEGVIINRDGSSDNYDENEIEELRVALRKLTYDPNYKSCFNGQRIPTFYAQALEKVGCWLKHETEIK